ncbi:MAG: glutamine--fructose-6-phosphate transaminase (isomerizing) [Candidatus Eisenbacteria bacterium]|nr:glutamine--fructose-6-phosphate transaminase (isomerizing) [Candidatus Eisenbacteria bacterium]
MCGIIGFSGNKRAPARLLMEGLKRLEYRGYDSAGIAWQLRAKLRVRKRAGKVDELWDELPEEVMLRAGIAHTRWATHGSPSDANAHPHTDGPERIALVHNGVIDNFRSLKADLEKRGHVFRSETDTEVLAHLISEHCNGSLEEAVRTALRLVEGTYGIAVMSADEPGKIVATRRGSPLIVGVGDEGSFVASDAVAMAGRADEVVNLEDGDLAVLIGDEHRILRLAGGENHQAIWSALDLPPTVADKQGYPHYMLKEIMEQPDALEDCFRGRIQRDSGTAKLGGLQMEPRDFLQIDRVRLLGCGTSYMSSCVGARMITDLARIETTAEYAPEYRYSNPIVDRNMLFFGVSQSGETADTIMAMREVQRKGGRVMGIVNRVASTIARETGAGIYIHAGFEYAVASTKTMLNTMMALLLFALLVGRMRDLSLARGRELIEEVEQLPEKIRQLLVLRGDFREAARHFADSHNFYFMGRGYSFPIAMEGALKLKEIAYVHAEGYSAAEMKHGPIALIDESFASVFVIPPDSVFSRTFTNLQEVRARKGPVLSITCGDQRTEELADYSDQVIVLPETDEILTPFLTTVAVQLFAYEFAELRGCPIDQPKNLAKSVTVE